MLPSSCLDGSVTPVGPGQNPQYTGAVQRREAVGCSQGLKMSPQKTTECERMSGRQYTRSHRSNAGVARKSDLYERLEGVPRCRIGLQWNIITSSQSTGNGPSLCGMLSRDQSLRSDTCNLLGTSGNFIDSPRAVIDSSSTPCQSVLRSSNQSATGENPARESTGKPEF